MRKLALAAAAAFALTAAPAAAQNLLLNGDFSDGLNGWQTDGTGDVLGFPIGWTWESSSTALGQGVGDMWQIVPLTPGETYTVQFDYQKSHAGFLDAEIGRLVLYTNYFQYAWDIPDSDEWAHFSATFVAEPVLPVYDGVQFTVFYNSGLPDRLYRIDNVSLTAASATTPSNVPEPATWAMMLLGFGAISFQLRHKRKAVQPRGGYCARN